jgi:hypothetical protein
MPGRWQVFCHHGAGQAIEAWPDLASRRDIWLMRSAVLQADGQTQDKVYPTMPDTWSAFYWRCRWAQADGQLVERLEFSLERCMR